MSLLAYTAAGPGVVSVTFQIKGKSESLVKGTLFNSSWNFRVHHLCSEAPEFVLALLAWATILKKAPLSPVGNKNMI